VVSYAWAYGNGAATATPDPTYTYTTPGTYYATLTVTDDQGATDVKGITIVVSPRVSNQPPVAVASATPTTGVAPLAVTFSSAGSTDSDGSIASFAWSFGDGTSATGPTAARTYSTAGVYRATLTVTDDKGATHAATVTITVTGTTENRPPVALAAAAPATGAAPLPVVFSSVGSYDPDGRVAGYAWIFGDGTGASEANPVHTYAAAGVYTATLTVTDDRGASSSSSIVVTVSEPPGGPSLVMGVARIDVEAISSPTTWTARAIVTLVDGYGRPVPNAIITGRWYGLVSSGFVFAATDDAGRATFVSRPMFINGGLGFTVSHAVKSGLTFSREASLQIMSSIFFERP
jgi:PKD repeat protein